MSAPDIELWINSRAVKAESIEQRHAEAVANMRQLGPPLGWRDVVVPPAPDCGGNLSAAFVVKHGIRGLKFIGHYKYRGERYIYTDSGKFDDTFRFGFKVNNKRIDYQEVLHVHLPNLVQALRGYRAFVSYDGYLSAYRGGYKPSDDGSTAFGSDGYPIQVNPVYNRLRADPSIEVDGRNNIYTLRPAHFWDNELCRRALGYDRDEVIRRLQSKVPKVEPLMDGVYIVFNDDPSLSYETFVEINERFKPILGLI